MHRFVLLKQFDDPQGALRMAVMIHARLETEIRYLMGWNWVSTEKTYPNGTKGQGPTLLACGTCDVLGIRTNISGCSDIYCHPDLKAWIEGGMEGSPPPPVESVDGGLYKSVSRERTEEINRVIRDAAE